MNQQIQSLAPVIWAEIERARNILLHFHVYPDGDSIGSTLGLYHALRSVGKNITVIRGDSPTPSAFHLVPGLAEVLPQTFGETDLSQFDLFFFQGTPHGGSVVGSL